jgi:hypothetical protein
MLFVSGLLDPTPLGPGTLDPAQRRRSIYFTVKRSRPIAMMRVFDAPDGLASIPARNATTVAPQALVLMNDPVVRAMALAFAGRLRASRSQASTDGAELLEDAIRGGFLRALCREPDDEELAAAVGFVREQRAGYAGDDADLEALADLCQVLFSLNEFAHVE